MNQAPEDLSRINQANDIYDAMALRLKFLEAVAYKFCDLHGTKEPVDHQQAALWYRIGEDVSAAVQAMAQLCELVRGGDDEAG